MAMFSALAVRLAHYFPFAFLMATIVCNMFVLIVRSSGCAQIEPFDSILAISHYFSYCLARYLIYPRFCQMYSAKTYFIIQDGNYVPQNSLDAILNEVHHAQNLSNSSTDFYPRGNSRTRWHERLFACLPFRTGSQKLPLR